MTTRRPPRLAASRRPGALLLALAALTACQVAGPNGTDPRAPRPKVTATPAASGGSPTPGATATPGVTASGLPTGLATRAPAAYFGRVLQPDGQPAAGVRVRAFLLSDQGSGLVSDQGTGLVSDQGTGVVANNGGGLITDNGAGLITRTKYALAQAPTAALETRTGEDGTFELIDPQGRALNLEAVASDALKAFRRGVKAGDAGFEMTLAPTGSIAGVVRAANVTDLIGVDVFVPGTGYVAKSDGAGKYLIPDVPVGTFDLYAAKAGLGSARATGVAVESRKTATAPELVLQVARPAIRALEPAASAVGTKVLIKGTNFAAAAGEVFQVTLAGAVIAGPERLDDGTIRFEVPAGAKSGPVVVSVGGVQGDPAPFAVLTALKTPVRVRDLLVGDVLPLRPVGYDAAGAATEGPALAWTASGPAVAVDAKGVVTAKALGDAQVVGTFGELKLTFDLHVRAPEGRLITLAGGPDLGGTDGAGGLAGLGSVFQMAFADAKTLWLTDYSNQNVRTIDLSEPYMPVVKTVAGGPGRPPASPAPDAPPIGGFADGTGRAARFDYPIGGAWDGTGFLVADQGNNRLRRVTPDGVVTTAAGSGVKGVTSGPVATAQLNFPNAVAVGPDGTIYLTQKNSAAVHLIKGGEVGVLAGATALTPAGDALGAGTEARFRRPDAIALDGRGGLLVADEGNYKIKRVDLADPSHPVTLVAGSTKGLADGVGAAARFEAIQGLAVAPDGTIYVADLQGWDDGYTTRLRKITPGGEVTTLWGSDKATGARHVDGPLGQGAHFGAVFAPVVSPDGKYLYMVDTPYGGAPALRRLTLP